jgi:hypothetical protein
LGNAGSGIFINSAPENTVGGTTVAARNLISGNNGDGIEIDAVADAVDLPNENVISGNFIGTAANGAGVLGNSGNGIIVRAGFGNVIGGTEGITAGGLCAGACNIISYNGARGIRLMGDSTFTNVLGNFVGTTALGLTGAPNHSDGVAIFDPSNGNLIGDGSAEGRNIIAANDGNGVLITGAAASNNQVKGNYIGTNKNGTAALANGSNGIFLQAPDNFIGGAGSGNLISGNIGAGISLPGTFATGNEIVGNYIGTDAAGTAPLGNGDAGISVAFGSNNRIGGDFGTITPDDGNIIAFNLDQGIIVGFNNNAIRFNSIFSNASPEIDLVNGNNNQAAPVLTGATVGSTNIQGSLTSAPSTIFAIDFYYSSDCAHPQGKTYLGSDAVQTNGSGVVNFNSNQATSAPIGSFITATATDPNNNTSEFSNCVQVVAAPPTATPTNDCTTKPAKPDLRKPADGKVLATTRPVLKWKAANCAETYTVIVKNTATGKKAFKAAGLMVLKKKTDELVSNTLFKWFVKACNAAGCTKSEKRKFSTPP